MTDTRLTEISEWTREALQLSACTLAPASSDASFRRYFRVWRGKESYVVMDAPPPQEDCGRFVRIAAALLAVGLNVPRVLAQDLQRGFLLLSDLGVEPYLNCLNETSADRLYGDAMAALLRLQRHDGSATSLPPYDEALLLREVGIFREWFVERHLGHVLSARDEQILADAFRHLVDSALEQPRVWVHRDFHSRNLMVTSRDNPGVLDFQDAVVGPITYDLVSLLRDCYIRWPSERVQSWAVRYWQQARALPVYVGVSEAQFLRWFDFMGAQRHIKAIGIFARLNHRDGKPGYLGDIPRTLGYVMEVAERHDELRPLRHWLTEHVRR